MNRMCTIQKKLGLSGLFGIEIILGFIKLVLSGYWHFWFGLVFSLLVMALAGVGVAFLWKSYKGRLWKILLVVSTLASVFLFILFLIQVVSWDFSANSFPSGCKKKTNCTRVTTDISTNVRGEGLVSPTIPSSTSTIQQEVKDWINSQTGTAILEETDSFIHARFVTPFWGFADDFYVQLFCQSNGTVAVWVQGEARLGTGDFNVNENRVANFIQSVNGYNFAPGKCF